MTIFVANFKKGTTEAELKELFKNYGEVRWVEIRRDWVSDEPLGYAFVLMPREREAEHAISSLDGEWWNGRRLKVSAKQERL